MSEILFRGKQLGNGKWVYGLLCRVGGTYANIVEKGTEVMRTVFTNTIGQFTGLTDKNGKKIFEWDIVKTKFGRICKVIFFQSPCYCGIDLIPLEVKHKCPDEFDLYLSDNLEIIGNVHDNSELLEMKE